MIINIQFGPGEQELQQLQDTFNDIGERALYMNHYELMEVSGIDSLQWRSFLMDSRVIRFLNSELELIKHSKMTLMLKDIDNNRSTGQAQLLNTLLNQAKSNNIKEGPIFIYSYIPPNAQERNAANVEVLNVDPFKVSD